MIRSPELAPQGQKKIAWAARHMPVLSSLAEKYASRRPFAGLKMALCIHLEAKTAYLARVFQRCGAQVAVTGSNPLSTQDDVAAALAREGIAVFGWRGATEEEYADHIRRTIDTGPNLVIDDGGDLITMLHRERPDLLPQVRGGRGDHHGPDAAARPGRGGELAFP